MSDKMRVSRLISKPPDASAWEVERRCPQVERWLLSHLEGEAQTTESRRSTLEGLEVVTLFDVATLGAPSHPPGLPFSHFLLDGEKIITVVSGAVFPWANPAYRRAANGMSAINWEQKEECPYWEGASREWAGYGLQQCRHAFFNHEPPGKYLQAGEASLAHIFEVHTTPAYQGQGHARRALTSLWPHLESFQSVGITSLYLWTQNKPRRFARFLKKAYQFQSLPFHRGRDPNRCLLRISPAHSEGLKKYQGPTVLDALVELVRARKQSDLENVKPGPSPEKVDDPG